MTFVQLGFLIASLLVSLEAGSVRGGNPEGRTISVENVQAGLQSAMQAVLDGDDASTKRAARIETRVWQTYQALPKNGVGRLDPRAVRYLVHNYFMKEHGWLIQGLDPHGNQVDVSELHEVNILQDKAPLLVESLLEARRSNHGLSLNDIVTMIAALERLIFDESLSLLQASYLFNDASMFGTVKQSSVHDILTSYLLLVQLGSKANLSDARMHRSLKNRVSQRADWPILVDFERDAVLNFNFGKQHSSNPFVAQQYTFQAGLEVNDSQIVYVFSLFIVHSIMIFCHRYIPLYSILRCISTLYDRMNICTCCMPNAGRSRIMQARSCGAFQGKGWPSSICLQDTLEIVDELAHSYGKWQNMECQQMKEDLMDLDADGDGRIPLGKFYAREDNTKYQFTESILYLKEVGALVETASGQHVRIANYLQGPSNCIASSTYYSVCCLSECEGVLNELEAKLQAPTADPKHLLRLLGNISSATVDAPRDFPRVMMERLQEIAEQNGGEVPLHGRLFSEWLHFAFPNECPYPHVVEEAKALTPSHWLDKKMSVDPQQRTEIAAAPEEKATPVPALEISWASEEVLHVHEAGQISKRGIFTFRTLMQVTVLLAVLRAAASNWRTLRALGGVSKEDKEGCFELPFWAAGRHRDSELRISERPSADRQEIGPGRVASGHWVSVLWVSCCDLQTSHFQFSWLLACLSCLSWVGVFLLAAAFTSDLVTVFLLTRCDHVQLEFIVTNRLAHESTPPSKFEVWTCDVVPGKDYDYASPSQIYIKNWESLRCTDVVGPLPSHSQFGGEAGNEEWMRAPRCRSHGCQRQ